MWRHCIILLLHYTFVFTSNLFSQQIVFKTYTVNDGLVANPVRRIFQDSKGFLWIATWDGLSKYDGHKFTNYSTVNGLSHNLINDFYEAEDGKTYVAQNNGATDIIENGLVIKKGVFTGRVINRFFRTRNNRVIVLTDTSGIYELKSGQLYKIDFPYPNTTFNDIAEFRDSLFILYSLAKPLVVLNSSYKLIAEIKESDASTLSIFSDYGDKTWLGTSSGLKNVSLSNNQLQLNPPSFHLQNNLFKLPVTCILGEKAGDLWVGTSQGLFRIKANGRWQRYTAKDGLPTNRISTLFQDKEKNIWIGTWMGLCKIVTRNKIELYTKQQGLSNNIHSFFRQPDNKLLVFCYDKIQQFNPDTESFQTLANIKYPMYSPIVNRNVPMLFSMNRIFIYDGIKRSMVEKFRIRKGFDIFCANVHGDKIILGTSSGLIIYSSGKIIEDSTLPYRITSLLIDKKGYLWISTWSNGLFRIKHDLLPSSDITKYETVLPGIEIRSLLEDGYGNIWAGTRYRGVYQIRQNNQGLTTTNFDHKKGLASTWIHTMTEDSAGNIWLGSILGLDKLIRKDDGYEVFNFSRVNDIFLNTYEIGFSKNNQLWCSTEESLAHITDDKTETMPALPIYITNVTLGTKRHNTNDPQKKVSLKHFQNQANFEFTAAGFINEKQILYSYRLLGGSDTSWSVPANIHSVSYASLQPGNYNFQVRTVGWNSKYGRPATFSFNINPPYWKTWWFIALLTLAFLIILFFLYRYRIQQLMQLQKVRNRLATDLHDDIGTTLTNISILSELSRKHLEQPQQARVFLHRITEEVTASGQALDDIIWSVNSRNDTIEETLTRMRRYAAELFDMSNVKCHLDLEEASAEQKLEMEQRRDLYLIFKESLNNIYKHAEATEVWVKVMAYHQHFEMTIRDDGKGFDINQPTFRNGIKNLRARVNKWKGTISIETLPGKGTHIYVSMPYN